MLLYQLSVIQLLVFLVFFGLENMFPLRRFPKVQYWNWLWFGLGFFVMFWMNIMFYFWVYLEFDGLFPIGEWQPVAQGFFFYIFYSFGNYWFHRWKHSNYVLWKVLHYLHHSPTHMETRVAFFRHPLETLANTLFLLLVGKLVFGASVEAIAVALIIEGSLETFHHANIRFPNKLKWLGYIVQIPVMHLLHHEQGLHRYNYSPFLWDFVFGTAKIPDTWNKRLGFANSHELMKLLLFKYRVKKHKRAAV